MLSFLHLYILIILNFDFSDLDSYYLHSVALYFCFIKGSLIMAGYCSKNFDIDTLTSILVPEQYFFDTNLNKITLFKKKTLVLFISFLAC